MQRPTKRTVYVGLILAAVAGLGIVPAQGASPTETGGRGSIDRLDDADGRRYRLRPWAWRFVH